MNSVRRILIIKPSALGDVATALPLLADLKSIHPDAVIDWLVQPSFAALLEGHPGVAEVIPFDRRKLASWWWKPSAFGRFWGLIKRLRRARYDVVVDAQGLLRSGFLTWITGAKTRVGFANAREGAAMAYTHRVALPGGGLEMVSVDRMRALAGALGANVAGPARFDVPIDAAAIAGVEAKIKTPYVVMIPGARWNTKRWPVERYAAVAGEILASGRGLVLLGSPDERLLCVDMEARLRHISGLPMQSVLDMAGRTTLKELIAWMGRAELVVGNDSGPLHIAVALGKRVVGIYGPTPPAFVGPYGQLENVVRHDVECHPCRRRECGHHSCMQGVKVEVVWEKIDKVTR